MNQKATSENNSGKAASVEITMKPFGMQSVIDFCEDFDREKWAMKTLAELLSTADMDLLNNRDNYQRGLCQLLELCVEKQEAQIAALKDMVENSPELLIEHAKNICSLFDEGFFSNPATSHQVGQSLNSLDAITSLFGADLYPEVETIKKLIVSKVNTGRPRKK